jgi:hypothetical protein
MIDRRGSRDVRKLAVNLRMLGRQQMKPDKHLFCI